MSVYLTDNQIEEMAQAAVQNYEFSCEWRKAQDAAYEHAIETWGIKPRATAVLLAVKLAKVKWQAMSMRVKAEVA